MPIPYMWSKERIAIDVYNIINAYTKDRKKNLLVDLFCWWFAVSEVFLKKWREVISNDKNKYVIALLKQTLKGLPDIVYNRVSKEKFNDIINNPSKYEDWYVWYIQCAWSFWNNQKAYLYWKNREEYKKQADDLVVRKQVGDLIKTHIPEKYIKWIIKQDTIKKRRLALRRVAKVVWKKNKNISKLQNLEKLQRLENLEILERLQRLKKLQKLTKNHITIMSKSYEEVEIPEDAIVYCDPPYYNTAPYAESNFDHKKFWNYMRKLSKTHKVFISEYTAPGDFIPIYKFELRSLLQQGGKKKTEQSLEKIFIYKSYLHSKK